MFNIEQQKRPVQSYNASKKAGWSGTLAGLETPKGGLNAIARVACQFA